MKKLISPPQLAGYNYTAVQAHAAARAGRLLAMRLETSNVCNLRCIYCNGASGKKKNNEIDFALIKKVIREVRSLGARSVIVIGGGEPTIYPRFHDLIRYICGLEMIPLVITNSFTMDLALAKFLYSQNASVLLKCDSFRRDIQDLLAGLSGAHDNIMRGVENLFSAGFNKAFGGKLRLGFSFVTTQYNYKEIPSIWKFCRENSIYPNMEEFIPRGRGLLFGDRLFVSPEKIKSLKKILLKIDRSYGYDWLVYAPLPGHGCLQHLYSIYLACNGYVRPCADIDIKLFNVKEMSIKEIVRSPFFKFMHNIEFHLEGRCSGCIHNAVCVGCRGNAFSTGIEEGRDIYGAVCREDPNCWLNGKKTR